MKNQILELRELAKARSDELLQYLMALKDTPELFSASIRDLKDVSSRLDRNRTGLAALEQFLATSQGIDQRRSQLEGKCRQRTDALNQLAEPLAKGALHAMRSGDLQADAMFQPMLDATEHIVALKARIDQAGEHEGFWGQFQVRAEKLLNQGKLKIAQVKRYNATKTAGKQILKEGRENAYRCELTRETIGQIEVARKGLDGANQEAALEMESQATFLASASKQLGVDSLNSTESLNRLQEDWKKETSENEKLQGHLIDGLMTRALDRENAGSDIDAVVSLREAREALDALCLKCARDLEPLDWPAAKTVLGASGARCPSNLNYLRGVPSWDQLVAVGDRQVGIEACQQGLLFGLLSNSSEQFVCVLRDSMVSIEMQDTQQIYEQQRGNVVAESLVGFLTGGVKGAAMRGAAGLKQQQVAIDMPDLVITIQFRDSEEKERSMHFALSFEHKHETANFFKRHCGDIFRQVSNQP